MSLHTMEDIVVRMSRGETTVCTSVQRLSNAIVTLVLRDGFGLSEGEQIGKSVRAMELEACTQF